MTQFFNMLGGFWKDLLQVLDKFSFDINGFSVSLPSVWFAFMVIGLVVTVFWKGAKT